MVERIQIVSKRCYRKNIIYGGNFLLKLIKEANIITTFSSIPGGKSGNSVV